MTDPCLLPSACHDGIGTPNYIALAAQYLACTPPLSTLRVLPRGSIPRMTRGQCGSLLLYCDGLSPSTSCRSSRRTAAQWLAYTLPYRRFADALADACAQIGGDVDCYSLIAVDFHHILLASFPAHSLALRPAHSRCHQFVTRYSKASVTSLPP